MRRKNTGDCIGKALQISSATQIGAVAQLGERRVRNAKVGSSILLRSTKKLEGPDMFPGTAGPREVIREGFHRHSAQL